MANFAPTPLALVEKWKFKTDGVRKKKRVEELTFVVVAWGGGGKEKETLPSVNHQRSPKLPNITKITNCQNSLILKKTLLQ